jgi:phosphatidylserine/phosphatidylglycerophosphate/cardiolipin synthase-like enzyme
MRRTTGRIAALIAATVTAASIGAASAAAAGGGLSVFAEPQAGVTPVLKMIDSAHKSIDLTMYELTDTQVEAALAGAAKRGVDVRVLLNRKDPFESSSPNAAAYTYLNAHGVSARYSPAYLSLTHEKSLAIDGSEAAILTLNLDGDYASTRDFGVLDTQPADVSAIVATFDADWAAERTTPSTGTGDLVWSPGAASTVLKLINGASKSIDLENEEMDYRSATSALCAAAHRGVDVKVVMTYSSEWASAFHELEGCGAHIHVFHGQAYYIHAKVLIADGDAALVGSQNLSTESLDYNRELGITLQTPAVVSEVTDWFESDYARGSSF